MPATNFCCRFPRTPCTASTLRRLKPLLCEYLQKLTFAFRSRPCSLQLRTDSSVPSPNSPTGSIATRGQILALAQAAPHALVLVDEAYFHFYGETVLGMISKIPNIIVARTFSKAYGLAALRLGLLAGSPRHLQWARRVLSPYSVNHVALTCLGAALHDQSYLDWYVKEVTQARGEFLKELTRIGVRHWPTEANFVLVEIGSAHKQFAAAMQHQGVLVRDRSADPGCDGCVRITIGTRNQMQIALAAIEAFLHSPQPVGVTP